jgi:AAA domain-containing protein
MITIPDKWLSPPDAVIGNLRFTKGGVYAEFVLTGQPGGMLPYSQKRKIAESHRPLVRQLPAGMIFSGLLAPLDSRTLIRRMLSGYENRAAWVSEVRDWEQHLQIEPFYERVFWLTVPVDSGLAGRTEAGRLTKTWGVLVGRDADDDKSIEGYRELAGQIAAKIPERFAPRPATPRQIKWVWRRHLTRGVADTPFPHGPGGPDRLSADDFESASFDEGDQASRRWSWLPTMKPVLRVTADGAASSYQALMPVAQLPMSGLFYPRAEYLLSMDDVDIDATADWFQYVTIHSAEKALQKVDWAQRNLNDQSWQRAGRRASDADLGQRYQAAEQYNAELRSSKLEREVEFTTVIAVGSRSREQTSHAVQQLHTQFSESLETALALPRGAQRSLWQIGNPGSEERVPLNQFSHPTTTKHWARFSPLVSCELGNDTGVLLGINLATRRPAPVFVDLEGAPTRRRSPGMLYIGSPGGGKSQSAKRVVDAWIKRGGQASISDPGPKREWAAALAHHGDDIAVIDPGKAQVSLDGLKIFPREIAVEHTLDHLLPMMGVEADAIVAGQLRTLLRPDQRVAESTGGLLRYLNSLTGSEKTEYAELTARLNMWSTVDYLRAMFDESLPVPPIAEKAAIIWLTADLELPTETETDALHLYRRQSPRARAGLAVYGMIAALTRVTYSTSPRRGVFVAEEARPYLASPVGKRETLRTVTQGRKEGFGFIGISQRVEDFDGIGREFLPQRVITPFIDPDYARTAFASIGIDPEEYPHVLETRTYAGHAYAYFIDEQGRTGLVDLLPPAQPQLVHAFDTTDMDSPRMDLGRNGQAGVL